MQDILSIVKDAELTFNQRFIAMAKAAEDVIDPIQLSEDARYFVNQKVVYDMDEGKAPYRPRYVIPDYDKFMRHGSPFLMLEPPKDIWEAISNLMILYHHVPGSGGLPVYIGHLDRLLAPYDQDEEETYRAVAMLLKHVDRTMSDAFIHCDIGPYDTRVGRIILDLSVKMQRPVPNMSLIYNEHTSDDFALKAIEAGLVCSKPSFVNDAMYMKDWGSRYAVASCYNVLPIGGGGYTLGRLNLMELGKLAETKEVLMGDLLHRAVMAQCEQMDKRIQFIVDDCRYFENSFLHDEGLIEKDKFVGMVGIVGLAECVNTVLADRKREERFGSSEIANQLAEDIINKIHDMVTEYKPKHGSFYLHGQVGIAEDIGLTPATRIPVGEEPELPIHLAVTARLQKHFATGNGDLYPFDATAKKNPQAVLDIIKGAFKINMRYISFYSSDSDVIRVTGYLVKLSDIEKLESGRAVLNNSTVVGSGAKKGLKSLDRKVQGFKYA